MQFHFKALRGDGELVRGDREAANKTALANDLRSSGLTIVSAAEINPRNLGKLFSLNNFFAKISAHDKILFARNLGSMLEAGLPLSRALVVMERQARSRKLKKVLAALNENISKGKAFSEALGQYPDIFSPLFVSMIKAGEESGGLGQALKMIGNQLDSVYLLERRVKGALIYPGIILSLMAAIAVLMLVYVVPTLTATYKDLNVELPWSTTLVIEISDFLKNNTLLAISIILLLVTGLFLIFRLSIIKRFFDRLIVRLPVIGALAKETNSARTARTLSSLLSAGVGVVLAIEITAGVIQNSNYKKVLMAAEESIKKGEPISAVFAANEHLYPPFVAEMIAIGEETGKLGGMLDGVAVYYETEVEQKTKDLSSIIEPVLMVIIGAVVGFFALSMILPMYSLVNNF